jgi:uncharacterized membrane protein
MNQFQSSAELKASAKEHLFGHYGTAIGANLVVVCIIGFLTLASLFLVDTSTIFGTVIYYLLSFAISVFSGLFVSGQCYFYLKISCGYPVTVSDIFYGFKLCPDKALTMQLFITAICYIAQLPMSVIGYQMNSEQSSSALMLPYSLAVILFYAVSILLSLIYQQAFYLLHDFPQYSAGELLHMSRKLMSGHKGRLFYIYVSFIPLILLGLLSCGIGLLWVSSYMSATRTEFFLNIIRNSVPEKMYT